jgi:transcriptional regulator with XRE-family HTH domain
MDTTLAERLIKAMNGPPKVSGVALARACNISGASVSDWRSGKTKTIEGSNLIAAADKLKVRAKWLADGIGPMRADTYAAPEHQANEPVVALMPQRKLDKLTEELLYLFSQLDTRSKTEYLAHLRGFVAGRRPHTIGKASNLAG